jgi:hypothetical protein
MIRYALDDHFLHDRLKAVVSEQNIEVVVETGIADGNSSREFCKMVPRYIGIDIDPSRIIQVNGVLTQSAANKWELLQGNSPDVLRQIMPILPAAQTLFFLDAHNHPAAPVWPLPEEIRAIPPGEGVLVLHDFRVPGKDFGVDGYMVDGVMRDFNYDLIRDVLAEWSASHRIEYATDSDPQSSYRGWGLVYPS